MLLVHLSFQDFSSERETCVELAFFKLTLKFPVHRLDVHTSGVLVFGKTKHAAQELHNLILEAVVKQTGVYGPARACASAGRSGALRARAGAHPETQRIATPHDGTWAMNRIVSRQHLTPSC